MTSSKSSLTRFVYVMFALLVALFVSQQQGAIADTMTTDLAGTSWQLVSFKTSENPSKLISGTTVTAQFDKQQVAGSGGCNNYSATYTTDDDSITISSVSSTEIACAPEINEQESRYFAALAGAQRYQVTSSGRLKIFYETDSEDSVLVFANTATSVKDLAGTSWNLVSLGTPGNLSEPIIGLNGRTLTAEFSESRVAGSGGCNSYGAIYETDDSNLSITSLFSTRIGCVPEILQQESRYFRALEGAKNYQIDEYGQLVISYQTESETGVLIYKPQ